MFISAFVFSFFLLFQLRCCVFDTSNEYCSFIQSFSSFNIFICNAYCLLCVYARKYKRNKSYYGIFA